MFINKSHIIITKTDINRKMNISFRNLKIKIMIYSLSITLIDQISKFIVLITLGFNQSIRIIPNILNFTLVKNNGAAFSLLSNSTPFLTFISILTSLILIGIIFISPPKSYWNFIGITYLLGGTIGNGIDRLFKGFVVDFLELVPVNFPIFNIADISINIAIICFIVDIFLTKDHSRKSHKK